MADQNWPEHEHHVAIDNGQGDTFLSLWWQHGPVAEVGVNGMQADDVLDVVLDYLRAVNVPPFNARETSLAITDIESAQNWLRRRTANRIARGVEGTSTP